MTIVDDHYAVAANVSEGWLDAVRMLDATASYKAIHLAHSHPRPRPPRTRPSAPPPRR